MDDLGLNDVVQEALKDEMNQLLDDNREAAASVLKQYLTDTIRKKDVPDLDERVKKFNERIDQMVETATIDVVKGEFVFKVSGSAEDTWKTLLRGSDWFEPVPDALEIVLSPLSQ